MKKYFDISITDFYILNGQLYVKINVSFANNVNRHKWICYATANNEKKIINELLK